MTLTNLGRHCLDHLTLRWFQWRVNTWASTQNSSYLQRVVPRCLTSQSTKKWKKNKDAGSHPSLTSLVFLGVRLRILALLTSFTRDSKWHCLKTTESSINTPFQEAIQVKDRLNLPTSVLSWGKYTEGVELRRKYAQFRNYPAKFQKGPPLFNDYKTNKSPAEKDSEVFQMLL